MSGAAAPPPPDFVQTLHTLVRFGKLIGPVGHSRLLAYKYTGEDHSWLSAQGLNKFWEACMPFVPPTVAPNVLTLLGLAFNVLSFLLVLATASGSTLVGVAPPLWVFVVFAFNLFAYQTLDNLDGKQARRTQSSSPLGELMDHGSDAVSMVLIAIAGGMALQLGRSWTLLALLLSIVIFYMQHWEALFTGSLILGKFGPGELQVSLMAVLVGLGATVPWLLSVNIAPGLPLGGIGVLLLTAGSFPFLRDNVLKVVRTTGTTKLSPEQLNALAPLGVIVLASLLWVLPAMIANAAPSAAATLCLLFVPGFAFAEAVTRLMVAKLTAQHAMISLWPLLPLAAATLNSVLSSISGLQLLPVQGLAYPVALWCFGSWLVYVLSITAEVCQVLGIHALLLRRSAAAASPDPTELA